MEICLRFTQAIPDVDDFVSSFEHMEKFSITSLAH